MDLLPKTAKQFNEKQYWETFFAKRGTDAFEWYGEYPQLCEVINKYVRTKDHILVAGCGNSSLSADMWNVGYKSMISVDISEVVIRQMQQKHGSKGMTFSRGDLLNLEYSDGEFSCVLDKGTLDALYTHDDVETGKMVDTMFQELGRVLRVGGRYVCVSLLQSHILRKLLHWFPSQGWMLRICRCKGAEDTDSDGIRFPVFVVICTKFALRPDVKPIQVLELSLQGEKPRRLPDADAVVEAVTGLQQYAFTRHGLSSLGSGDDVRLELCDAESETTRYVLYVVDRQRKKTARAFAVFIVPQGRETEWLFGTTEGRLQLAGTAGHDRLVVTHLVDRGHQYGALTDVQGQLSDSVLQLRPAHLRDGVQVPFLTCGGDLGRREVRHRGVSALSGDYVVEDVHQEDGEVCRRLVFLANPNVVQSEAKIRTVRGQQQMVPDQLACAHHRLMAAAMGLTLPSGTASVTETAPPPRLLVIGLGGGGLPLFVHDKFSDVVVDVVDIDPAVVDIAKNWFGFVEDDRMKVHVADGIQFIRDCKRQGTRYDLIMFDVDCKDPSLGMSCPPVPFVEPSFLEDVRDCVAEEQGKTGIFLLNLVARDSTLRARVQKDLCTTFSDVVTYSIPEEVNELMFCWAQTPSDGNPVENLLGSVKQGNSKLSRKRKGKVQNFVDVGAFARGMKKL